MPLPQRLEEHQRADHRRQDELTNDVKNIDPIRREVRMVFQQFNLVPASDRAWRT